MNSKYYALFFSLLLVLIIIPLQKEEVKADDSVDVDESVFFPMSDWWNENWSYCKEITINYSQVEGNLVNFPVCINITDTDLRDHAQSDGDDIAFISADNSTQYHHEIELYDNTNGELVAWVNVTSLAHDVDTSIYMYYGNDAASNQENITGVWDTNYIQILHLSNDFLDSTSNNNDATNQGSTNIEGKVGDCQSFDGSNDYIDSNIYQPTSYHTVEVLYKVDAFDTGYDQTIFGVVGDASHDYISYTLVIRSNGTTHDFLTYDTTEVHDVCGINAESYNSDAGNWRFLTATYDEGHIYTTNIDGVKTTVDDSDYYLNSFDHMPFGARYREKQNDFGNFLKGAIDEIRFSNIVRSDSWISTSYNTMNNATDSGFFTMGDEQTQGSQTTVSITVNKSSWNPSVNIGENESTGLSFFNLDNSGNVQVDVSVNASDTMNWSIAMSPSHNQFNLSYNTGSGWNLLDTIASSFASNLAYDEDVDFGLQLFMPTSSSTNSNQQSTITFTATVD